MGLFKKKEFVNLGDHCNRNQDRLESLKQHMDAFEEAELGSRKQRTSISVSSPTTSASGVISSLNNEVVPFPFISSSTAASLREDANRPNNSFDFNSHSSEEGEKKRKLANRLIQMTEQIEDLSNQIYHLQQRMEFLEKKLGSRGF